MGEVLPFTAVALQDRARFEQRKKQPGAQPKERTTVATEALIEAYLDDMERHASILRAQAISHGLRAEGDADEYRQGIHHGYHDLSQREASRWEQTAVDVRRLIKELLASQER